MRGSCCKLGSGGAGGTGCRARAKDTPPCGGTVEIQAAWTIRAAKTGNPRLGDRDEQASSPARAVSLMMLSAALFALNDATSKWLTGDYPSTQVWFLRTAFFVLPVLLVIAARSNWQTLRTRRIGAQMGRGLIFAGATLLIVLSLSAVPLVQVIAIVFSSPLIVAALGPLLLHEPTTAPRWIAIAVGFLGVLLIVQPGSLNLGWLILLPVAAAFSAALRDLVTRKLSATETSLSLLVYSGLIVMVIGAVMAPWAGWQPVGPAQWGLFALNGLLNGGAHFFLIEALRAGQAALVAPFKYTGLVWGIGLGYWLWGDLPDVVTLSGAALVIAGCWYLVRQEAK